MSKVLIINASKPFAHSGGRLNDFLTEVACDNLAVAGHSVVVTRIDDGYQPEAEVDKILQADAVIYQMPAWWMGPPWHLKRYMDDVFTAGHGKLYTGDGRTRSDPTKHYGSGGLLRDKRYLLSVTWNAPLEAFSEPGQFFEAKGVDAVYFPVHKANQFLGMTPLPTFMANDVIKNPKIERDAARYRQHLEDCFSR